MPGRVLVEGERARGVALVVTGVATAQFGAGFKLVRQLKPTFLEAL